VLVFFYSATKPWGVWEFIQSEGKEFLNIGEKEEKYCKSFSAFEASQPNQAMEA